MASTIAERPNRLLESEREPASPAGLQGDRRLAELSASEHVAGTAPVVLVFAVGAFVLRLLLEQAHGSTRRLRLARRHRIRGRRPAPATP